MTLHGDCALLVEHGKSLWNFESDGSFTGVVRVRETDSTVGIGELQ